MRPPTSTSDSTTSRSWIIRSKTTSMSRLRSGNVPRRWTSMNRGSSMSGTRRRDRRVEALGVPDRRAPRRRGAAAAIISSASSSDRAIGFSTRTGTPGRQERAHRDVRAAPWNGDASRASTWPSSSRKSPSGRVRLRGGDLGGARGIDVDDRHQLDAGQRRRESGRDGVPR